MNAIAAAIAQSVVSNGMLKGNVVYAYSPYDVEAPIAVAKARLARVGVTLVVLEGGPDDDFTAEQEDAYNNGTSTYEGR